MMQSVEAFNLVMALVGGIASCIAIWQFVEARQKSAREKERLAVQLSRNDVALRSAVLGAQMADTMVQRAKQDDVTIAEMQNLARVIRGSLLALTLELEEQHKVIEMWSAGRRLLHSDLPTGEAGAASVPEEA
jgi:hypothetical protein